MFDKHTYVATSIHVINFSHISLLMGLHIYCIYWK